MTGTMSVQSASTGTALTENAFKRSGYVFDGWATYLNGSNTYEVGFKYPFFRCNALRRVGRMPGPLRVLDRNRCGRRVTRMVVFTLTGTTADGCSYTSQKRATP